MPWPPSTFHPVQRNQLQRVALETLLIPSHHMTCVLEKASLEEQRVSSGCLGVGGEESHEIKRHLLLGRKAMTNLNNIFKSRDITLLTKICLVKGMVFPGAMYGCES